MRHRYKNFYQACRAFLMKWMVMTEQERRRYGSRHGLTYEVICSGRMSNEAVFAFTDGLAHWDPDNDE
jgi:hypothetical protein